jgi:DNA-binding XRE family transcriptional regulator
MASMSREDQKQVAMRAEEWKAFRRNFLYSQADLATALRCARRTIVGIEIGETLNPHPSLLKRFRNLQMAEERRERAATAWTAA